MPARLVAAVGLAAALANGARVDRHKASRSKFVAGVPVVNYHLAYEGQSLAETENMKQDWTIVVNPGVTDEEIQALCNLADCKAVGHPSKGGVPFLEVSCTEAELENLMYRAGKDVAQYVEPDSTVWAVPEIEASVEAATWGLNRIGRDSATRTGSSATIFVLDTGVRTTHTDFGGRASSGADVSSGSLQPCYGSTSCATDRQGHGTHCAGTAGGSNYGVARRASVSSIKVLGDDGSGSWSWSFQALDWVAAGSTRPAIASMSLGGPGQNSGMRTAVDAAVNAGVTVVVAAGNDNSNACNFSPAYVPSAITVGSTTASDSRSSFSNYGSCVDMWAPGSSVVSLSSSSDSGTKTLSGTSMACPHVAGGAALILGADNSKSPSKVLSDLLDDSIRNAISGLQSGDTNALLYVGSGSAPSPPSPAPTPPTPPTGGCVHQKDCDVSPWCTDTGFEAWCRNQGASCPAPYCTRV